MSYNETWDLFEDEFKLETWWEETIILEEKLPDRVNEIIYQWDLFPDDIFVNW